jgi:predicted dehydrogenase
VVVRPQDEDPEEERALRSKGVKVYRSVPEMLEGERSRVELIAIPTGIPSHAALSISALEAGYHVLCEKPAAGTHDDALMMREASRKSGKYLAIGFQYIFTQAVQNLKRIRAEARLGRLERMKAVVLWPRDTAYYRRNPWAGRLKADGRTIYDSPVQNGTSHFLNTMLYIAGDDPSRTAYPAELCGENYRAQDIESADTQFLRIRTDTDVHIAFVTGHASPSVVGPIIHFIFEKGTVIFGSTERSETYRIETSVPLPYELNGKGGDANRFDVFSDVLDAIRSGRSPLCTIDNALPHALCVQALFEESCPVRPVSREFLEDLNIDGDESDGEAVVNTVVTDMETMARRMFDEEISFSEAGALWAAPGRKVELSAC